MVNERPPDDTKLSFEELMERELAKANATWHESIVSILKKLLHDVPENEHGQELITIMIDAWPSSPVKAQTVRKIQNYFKPLITCGLIPTHWPFVPTAAIHGMAGNLLSLDVIGQFAGGQGFFEISRVPQQTRL
eukprot:SAG31_NODE_661_length_13035_cov_12.057591_11_plen_134_part_00